MKRLDGANGHAILRVVSPIITSAIAIVIPNLGQAETPAEARQSGSQGAAIATVEVKKKLSADDLSAVEVSSKIFVTFGILS